MPVERKNFLFLALTIALLAWLGLLLAPVPVAAQTTATKLWPIVQCGKEIPCTLCQMVETVQRVANLGLIIIGGAAVLAIIIAGIMYIVAAGSSELTQTAKKALTYAVTGLIVVVCAWLIVSVVATAMGYKQSLFTDLKCATGTVFKPDKMDTASLGKVIF